MYANSLVEIFCSRDERERERELVSRSNKITKLQTDLQMQMQSAKVSYMQRKARENVCPRFTWTLISYHFAGTATLGLKEKSYKKHDSPWCREAKKIRHRRELTYKPKGDQREARYKANENYIDRPWI